MTKSGSRNDGFLQEDLREQYKTIMEWLKPLRNVPADIEEMKAAIRSMQQEQALFRLVAKDISRMVNNHEARITKLEAA